LKGKTVSGSNKGHTSTTSDAANTTDIFSSNVTKDYSPGDDITDEDGNVLPRTFSYVSNPFPSSSSLSSAPSTGKGISKGGKAQYATSLSVGSNVNHIVTNNSQDYKLGDDITDEDGNIIPPPSKNSPFSNQHHTSTPSPITSSSFSSSVTISSSSQNFESTASKAKSCIMCHSVF
jgi:hypothetical protein